MPSPDSQALEMRLPCSVDAFHNVKTDDAQSAWYRRQPYTIGVRGTHRSAHRFASFEYQYDAPTLLDRGRTADQIDQTYRYRREHATVRIVPSIEAEIPLVLNVTLERKEEASSFHHAAISKALRRTVATIDTAYIIPHPSGKRSESFQPGIQMITRQADYQYYGKGRDPELAQDLSSADPKSPDSLRRELIPYLYQEFALDAAMSHRIRQGILDSYSEIREQRRSQYANEVKYHLAYSYQIAASCYFMFISTWDLDNLSTEFPFETGIVRPWDGGAFQMAATF